MPGVDVITKTTMSGPQELFSLSSGTNSQRWMIFRYGNHAEAVAPIFNPYCGSLRPLCRRDLERLTCLLPHISLSTPALLALLPTTPALRCLSTGSDVRSDIRTSKTYRLDVDALGASSGRHTTCRGLLYSTRHVFLALPVHISIFQLFESFFHFAPLPWVWPNSSLGPPASSALF